MASRAASLALLFSMGSCCKLQEDWKFNFLTRKRIQVDTCSNPLGLRKAFAIPVKMGAIVQMFGQLQPTNQPI
ncbi:hypothetical protein HOLleu_06371 [Holothuria leucospilota]|uniref:Uncharacterized protein n=1 Tax=Holothuria leucospilota TaxID=206669 RepID=A0A9Q1HI06_HOLLE|nr:hypothetical protein HOLleu_06371 [Holothuria leucospilota]